MTPALLFEYIFALIMAPVAALVACFVIFMLFLFVVGGGASTMLYVGAVWQSLKIRFANRRSAK